MELEINREKLIKIISRVQNIIERKSTMPILSTVLLNAQSDIVSIFATDLEIGFKQTLTAKIISEGSVTISARKLFEILRESNNENIIIQEKQNNWVFISDGSARYNLASFPPDEYPELIEPSEIEGIDIPGHIISEMINKTIYAVTSEDAGYKLSGIFTEILEDEKGKFLRMVATDGHRMSLIDKYLKNIGNFQLSSGIMIPKKAMNEISKIGAESNSNSIFFAFKDKYCIIKKDKMLLSIRLLETRFPDYKIVIPKETPIMIHLNRNLLLESMRKMLILSNERYRAVKMSIGEKNMELISMNPDVGNAQENIPIDYDGQKIEVGFNPKYFVDALQSMESENITLGFKDKSKPCVLKGEADVGFLALMMPMVV
jgi:DNA polymerase-3 subunit beta